MKNWNRGLPKKFSSLNPTPRNRRLRLNLSPNYTKIAIVIDDLGYDRPIAQEFIDLQAPLTLSFLPQAPHAKEMALLAREKGKETLLHLPMEPLDYPRTNPGPGALLLSMSANEILQIIDNDFKEFPFVTGG